MIKHLLLTFLLLMGSITLSLAQTNEVSLGQAKNFAVLAATEVTLTGTSGVNGHIGVRPGGVINGTANIDGEFEIGTPAAEAAYQDALEAYNSLKAMPATPANLDATAFEPGVYVIDGDFTLSKTLKLTSKNNPGGVFVFIVNGSINTLASNAAMLLLEQTSPDNVYWVVRDEVNIGSNTDFQGTILAKGNITIHDKVSFVARVISLEGSVSLENSTVSAPVDIRVDVQVTKTAEQKEYKIGDEITYTLTAINKSEGVAYEVVVTDLVPLGLEYLSHESPDGTTVDLSQLATDKKIFWNIPAISYAGSTALKITFKITDEGVAEDGTVNIRNIAVIGSKYPEPDDKDEDNETDFPIDVPELNADLSITKTADKETYTLGDEVTYTVEVTNNGPYDAEAITITDKLPEGLVFVSASPVGYDPLTGEFALAALAEGEKATVTIKARIIGVGELTNLTGSIANTATVATSSTTVPDKVQDNNNATVAIGITCNILTDGIALTGGETTLCEGQQTTFTLPENLGLEYTFSYEGGVAKVSETENTVTVEASANGKVIVLATDLCGNTYTSEAEITVTPQLTQPTITGSDKVCENSSGNVFAATTYEGEVSYEWSTTGDLEITSGQNTSTVEVSAGGNGGVLMLKVTNGCFTVTATKPVGVNLLPAAPESITGPAKVCAGTEQTYIAAEVTGAAYYTWQLPEGWSFVGDETGREVTVLVGEASEENSSISVKANTECGASLNATAIDVAVNDVPEAPVITGENGACIGTTLVYEVPALDGENITYEWNVPETWGEITGQGTSRIEVAVGQEGGTITVAIRNECGLGAVASKEVAPVLAPTAPVITGNTDICEYSQQLTYTISNPEDGATYTWALPDGWSFEGSNTGTSVTVNAGTAGGAISVVAANGCGTVSGQLQTVVFAPPVTPGAITDNSSVCDGLIFTIDPVEGASAYTWNVSQGFTIVSGQGTTTITVKANKPDITGTVTVMAINGPCSSMEASAPIDAAKADGNLEFPKAFSPNGDGTNDNWEIKNLEKFPNNEIIIFNRWGSEVFKAKNYQNNWSGKGLEQGTYFYKVRVTVCDGVVKEFTGYTTIFR
ncbi:ice-binding family protein [Pontibacter mangrovi]|uniref:DUF3494 domain-containing protein n=1 Tax=Pontibacter mangrovi TaxID=2589816 RepID=A0A501W3T1_9BACT|nr:ice-binding family protein [Pontibacter mangrovi]TPE40296.1 DUF3494 domain-containing protein [Pontibacter mangrovi]